MISGNNWAIFENSNGTYSPEAFGNPLPVSQSLIEAFSNVANYLGNESAKPSARAQISDVRQSLNDIQVMLEDIRQVPGEVEYLREKVDEIEAKL